MAVRLQIPTAHYVPTAFFDQTLYTLEQCGLILFDPTVENDFVMVKYERSELFTQVGSDAECRDSFSCPFLPLPQPDRIKMGIA